MLFSPALRAEDFNIFKQNDFNRDLRVVVLKMSLALRAKKFSLAAAIPSIQAMRRSSPLAYEDRR